MNAWQTATRQRRTRHIRTIRRPARPDMTGSIEIMRILPWRCDLAILGAKAEDLLAAHYSDDALVDGKVRVFLGDLVAVASTYGLIRKR